jgi:hypothetical protein
MMVLPDLDGLTIITHGGILYSSISLSLIFFENSLSSSNVKGRNKRMSMPRYAALFFDKRAEDSRL